MGNKKIRLLIVDDSETTVELLKNIIERHDDFDVVGISRNGFDAIEKAKLLKPDLITMDLNMPDMAGDEAIKRIMSIQPTPIVVISSHTQDESLSFINALNYGALTGLEKPKYYHDDTGLSHSEDYIIQTLRAMSQVRVGMRNYVELAHDKNPIIRGKPKKQFYDLVGIGCSTGGPHALATILSEMPKDFPVPIVVVQHILSGFESEFVAWLNTLSTLRVCIAHDRENLLPGQVYFAPDGFQLKIKYLGKEQGYRAYLTDDTSENRFKPSVDYLFSSLEKIAGNKVVAGILSGMGDDGSKGLKKLHSAGAKTFAQDEATSIIYGMPKAAINAGAVMDILPLSEISSYLIKSVYADENAGVQA